jgi:hypothetical protein
LEDLGVGGKKILELILGKWGGRLWTGFVWVRKEPVVSCCEDGNKHSGIIKGGKFLDQLSDYQLLKDCVCVCVLLELFKL